MKYIYDDNKVIECISNIAKMTVIEHIYYSIFHWNYFGNICLSLYDSLKDLLKSILSIIINIITIVLFPFLIIVYSVLIVRGSKKWMDKTK